MATKKTEAISRKSTVKKIQQVLWEKHLQEFPQRQYKWQPVTITVSRERDQQGPVEYTNDV